MEGLYCVVSSEVEKAIVAVWTRLLRRSDWKLAEALRVPVSPGSI
jgi:hypothetical protein